MALVVMSQIFS